MDAKPQRIRVRGDENVPLSLAADKAVHQRNKSTSALNVTAIGAKNGTRRVFGDVSNIKTSRDDSSVGGKPVLQVSESKPALSQPAQRPTSMSSLKGLLNNATSKPVNPAGKAQPASKGVRRPPTIIFRDHLEPVIERETPKEANSATQMAHREAPDDESMISKNEEKMEQKQESSVAGDGPALPDSDTTIPETDESKALTISKPMNSTKSEPEEYWHGEEGDTHGAPASPTGLENTIDNQTPIKLPVETSAIRRELDRARYIVERFQTKEDILEDQFDTSMVAEYNDDIFAYLKAKELQMLPARHYMDLQVEVAWSMRSVLMDWVVQVHHRFALLPETLFLCVNYIDRFLTHKVVSLGKLQLVGATALFIAAKYEEITAPSVQEIVYMVDGGYSADEILKAERFMLSILNYDLGWPGPMSFLRRISKADDYDLDTRTFSKYLLEVTVMDERFAAVPPSFLAAGAHCLARLVLDKGVWTFDHAHYSGYIYGQLLPVMDTLMECCQRPLDHHRAIYEKYSDRRFKRVSTLIAAAIKRGFFVPGAVPLDHPQRMSGETNF
ncbi:hypothetical protein N7512_008762 [Penicillium capsulatum]|nr:hypothetical protein N7512_008762 [Penicillium capsulatum]